MTKRRDDRVIAADVIRFIEKFCFIPKACLWGSRCGSPIGNARGP